MTNTPDQAPPSAQSAIIIAFPRRFQRDAPMKVDRPSAPSPGLPDPDRLSRAMAALLAAQQEQKAALARWRAAIEDLRGGVRTLETSLQDCSKALKTIPPSGRPG